MMNNKEMALYTNSFIRYNLTQENIKDFNNYMKKLPMYIRNNGIMLTVYFLKGKSSSDDKNEKWGKKLVYNYLKKWVYEKSMIVTEEDKKKYKELGEILLNFKTENLILLTQEIISLSEWGIRISENIVVEQDNKDKEQEYA